MVAKMKRLYIIVVDRNCFSCILHFNFFFHQNSIKPIFELLSFFTRIAQKPGQAQDICKLLFIVFW